MGTRTRRARLNLPWWVWLIIIGLFPIGLFLPWWIGATCLAAISAFLIWLARQTERDRGGSG